MAGYYGLDAIAQRMECHVKTVQRYWKHQQFLMYKRRRNGKTRWYTNDQLIHSWEISKCLAGEDFLHRSRNPQASTRDSSPMTHREGA